MPRSFPIVQFPNRPLIATVLAAAIACVTRGRMSSAARLVSRLVLLVWSAEEIVDGADWFRRLLGVGGAALGVAELARRPGGDWRRHRAISSSVSTKPIRSLSNPGFQPGAPAIADYTRQRGLIRVRDA